MLHLYKWNKPEEIMFNIDGNKRNAKKEICYADRVLNDIIYIYNVKHITYFHSLVSVDLNFDGNS